MKTKAMILAVAFAGAAFATPAAAQEEILPGEGFVGVQAGFHDLGLEDEDAAAFGIDLNDSSPIAGVFIGYDLPLGPTMFVGAEANYTHGFDAIDSEYGVAGRLGIELPGDAKLYARGGYQFVDLDVEEVFGTDFGGAFDDEDGDSDFILGIGADIGLGDMFVRANVDTISFDTVRGTAGVGLKF